MTDGYRHIFDGEGPGLVLLTSGVRTIHLRGAEAAEARKKHDDFVARFGHDSAEERNWIETMILYAAAAE